LFDVVRSWWETRTLPNVLIVHYRALRDDLGGHIARIAKFLGFDPALLRMDAIIEHCSFGYMRARPEHMVPLAGQSMSYPTAFFQKGPSRDFRTELRPEQIARFDRAAIEKLGSDGAQWLETGSGWQ